MTQARYVGIDLGTSTSALAHIREDGNPEIVPNADGERLTPSVVYFDPYEKIKVVGSVARDSGEPDRTVQQIKRFMDDPDHTVELDGEIWTPTEISALILAKLKRECAQIIGEIEEAVITVPANFNELARSATVNAARLAGLRVTRLVNEPTAAALYYTQRENLTGRLLVYDLGGGTLDITILETDGSGFRILVSEGARHLGGANIDELVLEMLADRYRESKNDELYQDERERRKALAVGEEAKKMLSKLQHVFETFGSHSEGPTRIELTRSMFEDSVARLLTRTVMLVEQALDSAGLQASDIDHVVLVGGSTRIPKVVDLLRSHFDFDPISCGNVDECVALGAALFAQRARSVAEVCNQSYGTIALLEDASTGESVVRNSIVIPKNTPIPCAFYQRYLTSDEGESVIEVEITQGEDTDPHYVDILGKVTLEVPAGRPAECPVTVTYSYDENQRVHVHVLDEASGLQKEVAVQFRGAGVLSESELQRKAAILQQTTIA